MIDYAERVEDAALVARSEFGVQDTQAVELLLAARIECGLPYPWIVLETPFYRLDATGAWFAYLFDKITVMPLLRTMRPRVSNAEIIEILRERDAPRLFVEPNFEVPSSVHYNFKLLPFLVQECIRIKTTHPKIKLTGYRSGQLLEMAVKGALDNRFRTVNAVLPDTPTALPYWCELLQRISPPLRDWEALLQNLCALAGRRAYLFNRRVDSTDWAAVSRVMRDSVPMWVKDILTNCRTRGRIRSLRGKYKRGLVENEIERLLKEGVLINNRGEWMLRNSQESSKEWEELLIQGVNLS